MEVASDTAAESQRCCRARSLGLSAAVSGATPYSRNVAPARRHDSAPRSERARIAAQGIVTT